MQSISKFIYIDKAPDPEIYPEAIKVARKSYLENMLTWTGGSKAAAVSSDPWL